MSVASWPGTDGHLPFLGGWSGTEAGREGGPAPSREHGLRRRTPGPRPHLGTPPSSLPPGVSVPSVGVLTLTWRVKTPHGGQRQTGGRLGACYQHEASGARPGAPALPARPSRSLEGRMLRGGLCGPGKAPGHRRPERGSSTGRAQRRGPGESARPSGSPSPAVARRHCGGRSPSYPAAGGPHASPRRAFAETLPPGVGAGSGAGAGRGEDPPENAARSPRQPSPCGPGGAFLCHLARVCWPALCSRLTGA